MAHNANEQELRSLLWQAEHYQIDRVDMKDVLMELVDPRVTEELVDRSVRDPQTGRRPYAPRYELTIVRYDTSKAEGQRGKSTTHYVEERDLLVIANRILTRYRGEKNEEGYMKPIFDQYQGSKDRELGGIVVSRYLEVKFNGGLTKLGPCYEFTFIKQDGIEGQKGEVRPKKDGTVHFKDMIRVPAFEAEAFALQALTYVQGKRTSQIASDRSLRKKSVLELRRQLPEAA